jgi:hypothetical protein
MQTPSLTRPPRTRRPPQVARHVGALLDAYRRVQAGRKRGKRRAPAPSRPRTTA